MFPYKAIKIQSDQNNLSVVIETEADLRKEFDFLQSFDN